MPVPRPEPALSTVVAGDARGAPDGYFQRHQPLTLELSGEQISLLRKMLTRQCNDEVSRLRKVNLSLSTRLELAEDQLRRSVAGGRKYSENSTVGEVLDMTIAPRKPDDLLEMEAAGDEHPCRQVPGRNDAASQEALEVEVLIEMDKHSTATFTNGVSETLAVAQAPAAMSQALKTDNTRREEVMEAIVVSDLIKGAAASFYEDANDNDSLFSEVSIVDKWGDLVGKLMEQDIGVPRNVEIVMRDYWLRGTELPSPPCSPMQRQVSPSFRFDADLNVKDKARKCPCVLHPHSSIALTWQLVSLMTIFWDLIVIPLQQFDLGEVDVYLEMVGYGTSVYWVLDIFFNFLKGFELESGDIEVRLKYIALHYAYSWLIPDLLIVGVDIVIVCISFQAASESSNAIRSTRMMRAPRLVRLVRLARVQKIKKAFLVMANKISNMYVLLIAKVLSGLLLLLLVNHVIACAWMALGEARIGGDSWILRSELEHSGVSTVYISALHWSITQFMPATNDIAPANGLERLFTVVVIMFAMGVFSSFISSITNAVNSMREVRNEQIRRETILRKFFSERNLSTDLFLTIQDFCQKAGVAMEKIQEQQVELLRETPEGIRIRLHTEMFLPTLLSAHWLPEPVHDMDSQLFARLCHFCMSEQICQPQVEVFNHEVECTQVIIPQNSNLSYSLDGETFEEVPSHSWICEYALWASWEHCGVLKSSRTSRLIMANVHQFCIQVTKTGGPLFEYLQTFGVLLVGMLEAFTEDGSQLTDLPCGAETVDDLASRALRWKKISVKF